MAQLLRANTQVKVVIGPVVAVGDGFTPVTTLSLGAADEAELMKHDAAAVVDISAATFAAITSADGYYNLTLTTSHTDTEGLLTVLVNDDSLCLPVKQCFMVLSEAAWDSIFVAKDDGFMDVNIKTIGRTDTQETEASNLETACANYSATRGLAGTALPSVAAESAGGLYTRGTGAGQINQPSNGVIDANAIQVSGDATAADNLETMLDGTGGQTLTLKSLVINNTSGVAVEINGSTSAILIDAANGYGINIGSTDIAFYCHSSGNYGTYFLGGTNRAGLRIKGGGTAPGAQLEGGADSAGLYCIGAGTGAGALLVGGATGPGARYQGGATSGAGVQFVATAGNSDGVTLTNSGNGVHMTWPTAWDAEVQSEVQDAIEANHLDHLLAADYDPASKPGVATALLNELVENDGGVSRYTANALEQGPGGGSAPTAAQVADAVWNEMQSGHTSAGTFGKYLDSQISLLGGAVGAGAVSYTATIQAGGVPVDNVAVWVSTDSAGSNIVAGTLYTNSSGQVTFMLDAGNYYLWRQHATVNFPNPTAFDVP